MQAQAITAAAVERVNKEDVSQHLKIFGTWADPEFASPAVRFVDPTHPGSNKSVSKMGASSAPRGRVNRHEKEILTS